MRILGRYILKGHIGPFLFGTSTVMFLFMFQFILKYIDQLVGKGLSEWVIIQLIAYNLSWMLVLAVPMGVLFSTLMAFGGLSASQEVTIIKASGGSLIRMMIPVLFMGALTTLFVFWFNDAILPEANHRAKALMNDITRKKPTFSIEAGQFSAQLEGVTILARSVDSLNGTLKGVTIYDNRNREMQNIISADTGKIEFTYDQSKLLMNLTNGEVHQLMKDEVKNYRIINFKTYQIVIGADGFAFDRSSLDMISRGDREMRIKDMQIIVNEANRNSDTIENKIQKSIKRHFDYVSGTGRITEGMMDEPPAQSRSVALRSAQQRISFISSSLKTELGRKEDYLLKAEQYDVEIQKKYAIPFACFIFVLIGCPLGIITRGGNFGFSAAISLAFYVFYWACLMGGEKLADRGYLSAVISMWLGNFLIGMIGILLVIKVNNESFRFPGARALQKYLASFKKK